MRFLNYFIGVILFRFYSEIKFNGFGHWFASDSSAVFLILDYFIQQFVSRLQEEWWQLFACVLW